MEKKCQIFCKKCLCFCILVCLISSYIILPTNAELVEKNELVVISELTEISNDFIKRKIKENSLIAIDEKRTLNTVSVVKKSIFDDLSSTEKIDIKNKCIEDLNNKKAITFIGCKENLNIEHLYDILDLDNPVEFNYKDHDSLNDLKSITFYYGDNEQLYIDFYLNEKEECKIYDEIIVHADKNVRNKIKNIDCKDSDLCLVNVSSGSGNPAIVTYNQIVHYQNTYLMEVYYTLEANRIDVGDDITVWEVNQRITTSPFSNYNAQTESVNLYINDNDSDDEWLEQYLLDSTVNSNNSSTSVSFGYSKNGVSAQASISQGMSYSDVNLAANFHRLLGNVNWTFSFVRDSNVAKNSYTMQPKVIMTNKIGDFCFEYGGKVRISFTRFLFSESIDYVISPVSLNYPDIKIK